MKNNHNLRSAFSLLEISMVLLIVGILITGVIQTGNFFKRMQLTAARSLTINSPVNASKDLVLWYETSLESSFDSSESSENDTVSTWYDNARQLSVRNNATQTSSTLEPKFYENVFGGIGSVRFDGTDDFMNFDGSALIGKSYTIFIVEQRRATNGTFEMFLGGTASVTDGNLHLGYNSDSQIVFGQSSNDLSYSGTNFSGPKPAIHTFAMSTLNGKKYWMNGGVTADASQSSQTTPLTSFDGAALARFGSYYFNGDLAEIIIFNRALSEDERQAIENYLSKKYSIKIS